jgi:hypothetical protein
MESSRWLIYLDPPEPRDTETDELAVTAQGTRVPHHLTIGCSLQLLLFIFHCLPSPPPLLSRRWAAAVDAPADSTAALRLLLGGSAGAINNKCKTRSASRNTACSFYVWELLCQASSYECSLFLLISFVCNILETLLDGREVRSHLPEVA